MEVKVKQEVQKIFTEFSAKKFEIIFAIIALAPVWPGAGYEIITITEL